MDSKMNVLEKIVLDKREEVSNRKALLPLETFISGLSNSTRSFFDAIKNDKQKNGRGFILEVKKASPSKGLIRERFDLEEICTAYKDYASCVSVLTDEKYFQGDFERLPKVRELLAQPILCKDFFVDIYQVYLARFYGADAVLLMLSVLNDNEYKELSSVANDLGLDVLTEVSNEEEMLRAIELEANIIGINNRNLRDLSTDLKQTVLLEEVFRLNAPSSQKQNTLLISESGIYNHQQINQLSHLVDGFLVGSSLMAEKDIKRACQKLTFGEHKVCGLTNSQQLNDIANAGASYAGFIFAQGSKRQISLEQAKEIVTSANSSTNNPLNRLSIVAVVQNQPIDFLLQLVAHLPLSAIQLHGTEDDSYITLIKDALAKSGHGTEIWKAISIGAGEALPEKWPNVDRIVLDAKSDSGELGGTGITFDWSVLAALKEDFTSPKIFLAGGLNQENFSSALSLPVIGLDFNSGLEDSPGQKSTSKINTVFSKITSRTTSLKEQHEFD
ncbi:bifunctional indole-3-glycerol-phosphate synthase TrpC/phosphoribosylanthranilate isomerase TrpF [Psychrosphaera aestuarii]